MCIFIGLDATHTDTANALAVVQDGQAAFQHAVDEGGAQECRSTAIDHVLEALGIAATYGSAASLGRSHMGRQRRCAVHAQQRQQVSAGVDNGDGHGPLVFGCLGQGGSGDSGDVGKFKFYGVLHGAVLVEW